MNRSCLGAGAGGFLVGAFQVTIEAGAAYAQKLRGANAIAFAGFQDALDVHAANFVERQRAPGLIVQGREAVVLLQMLGQIGDVDEIAGGGDGGAGEHVLELADVAGPIVVEEHDLGAAGQAEKRFTIGFAILLEEMLDENRDIFGAVGESGNAQFDGTEAIVKILAEAPGEDLGAKIAIGGGDQAHIHGADFGRADALDFAILDYTQNFRLHGQGHFPDFVEKHGAAVGKFEEPGASVGSAGERSANVAEKLAFEQRVHQSGTIADGEAGFGDGTHFVEGVRDQLFAGTGGAGDQDVGVVARDFASEIEHIEHRRAFTDDAVEFEIRQQLLLEVADLHALGEDLGQLVERFIEALGIEGLAEIVAGAAFDGFDGGIEE